MNSLLTRLGIRTKLILLFVFIKLITLLLLAVLAWQGVARLGQKVSERNTVMTNSVRETVGQLSDVMTKESVRALDVKSRELIERLTTDTALAVGDFLRARDNDILLAATLNPSENDFDKFVSNRKRLLAVPGTWVLSPDEKGWTPDVSLKNSQPIITPDNPENKQDFNYRPSDHVTTPIAI